MTTMLQSPSFYTTQQATLTPNAAEKARNEESSP